MKGVTKEQQSWATKLKLRRAVAYLLAWIVVTGLKRALFKTIWSLDSETRTLDSETRQNLKFSNYSYTILTQYLYNIYTISLTMTYNGLQWFGQWNNNGHFIAMVINFYFLPLFINVINYCSILMVINFYFKPLWNNVIFYCVLILE